MRLSLASGGSSDRVQRIPEIIKLDGNITYFYEVVNNERLRKIYKDYLALLLGDKYYLLLSSSAVRMSRSAPLIYNVIGIRQAIVIRARRTDTAR